METNDIRFAAEMIRHIDSGEGRLFLEYVNTPNAVAEKVFAAAEREGVLFAFLYNGCLRIHIALRDDTDVWNDEIVRLIREARQKAGLVPAMVWLRNENRKAFECVKVALLANLRGYNPMVAVEFARKSLQASSRPSFQDLEAHLKAAR